MVSAVLRHRATVPVVGIAALGVAGMLPWWREWGFDPFGRPTDLQGWNVWETSRLTSAAVVLSALALPAGLLGRRDAGWFRRLVPVAAAWTAVLLLVDQVNRLGPADGGIVSLTDVQGIEYVRARTPDYLTLPEQKAPVLSLLDDENFHHGIGYGGYLGAALVLAVAVLLTWRLRRPAAASSPPPEESAAPATG